MPQFLPLPSNGSAKHFTWKCGKREQWLDLGECSGIHHTILSNLFGSAFIKTWLGVGDSHPLTPRPVLPAHPTDTLPPPQLTACRVPRSTDHVSCISPNLCPSWADWNHGSLQSLLLCILSTSTPLSLWYSPGWHISALYHLHLKSWIRKNNKQFLLETYHL